MTKIECKTPTAGKSSTRIDKWKYDKVAQAILSLLPESGEGVLFKELPDLVAGDLGQESMREIGSSSWYTTTVKLDLEVKGLIHRVPKVSPQRLLKS